LWRQLAGDLEELFDARTLEQLCQRAAAAGVRRPEADGPEYFI
jgi:hypothetical protein